jgi:hypothetical protein
MTNKSLYKEMDWKSLVTQVGGKHYASFKIQPARFINENMLPFAEGNVIKYICRHSLKNKKQDLEKAKTLHRYDYREGLFRCHIRLI